MPKPEFNTYFINRTCPQCQEVFLAKRALVRIGKAIFCGLRCRLAYRRSRAYPTAPAEYRAWHSMRRRCYSPRGVGFKNYGGRGITVCERWLTDFPVFLADMGRRPSSQHSLERINNDGNYEPSNCKWATWEEQCQNRRRTIRVMLDNSPVSLMAACRALGFSYPCIRNRMNRLGLTFEQAITIPMGQRGNRQFAEHVANVKAKTNVKELPICSPSETD